MVMADADLVATDSRNAIADQISRATKVHIQTISGAANLQKEIRTKAYILDRLCGANCPLTLSFTTELIPFTNDNFSSFKRQVNSITSYMAFTYDLSRIEAEYYNSCIRASTTTAMGDPGARTPASFQILVNKLRWSRYRRQPLSPSLQSFLSPSCHIAPPPLVTSLHNVTQGRNPGVEVGRGIGREGNPIQNPRPIQRIQLRAGGNTRGALRNVVFPTIIKGCVFCKCWYLGGHVLRAVPAQGPMPTLQRPPQTQSSPH